MFFLSVLTGESFWLGITDCKKDLYFRVSDELCVFIWHFFGIKPKHALSYWHSDWLHSQQLECSKYQIVDGLERVTTNVYCLLCNIVQSKLQEEIDKCRNQRELSNTLFWTLLISSYFISTSVHFLFFMYPLFQNIHLKKNADYCNCVFAARDWLNCDCRTNLNLKKLLTEYFDVQWGLFQLSLQL